VAGQRSGEVTLWKNGVPQPLGGSGSALSVFVSGYDVYAAGYLSGTSARRDAVLWKNGVGATLSDTRRAAANSVFASGGDVYVAGHKEILSDIPTAHLWKGGAPQAFGNPQVESDACSVFVLGDDVYVAGYEYDYRYHTQGYRTAKLWRNGAIHDLSDGKGDAAALSVFVK
jgi:hypothetical protein